jgi:hypothetical protein
MSDRHGLRSSRGIETTLARGRSRFSSPDATFHWNLPKVGSGRVHLPAARSTICSEDFSSRYRYSQASRASILLIVVPGLPNQFSPFQSDYEIQSDNAKVEKLLTRDFAGKVPRKGHE